tara:strand:+ start:796 stop:2337 length:1542 start_codon:yes stop_codon:yes gene_type:complete
MPSFRIGFGSDFSVNSNGVGIGTTFAASNTKLDVVGTLKGDFNVTGVTTLTAYGGFVAQRQYVDKSASIGSTTIGVGTVRQYYETETGFTDLGGVHHGDDQYYQTVSEDLVIDDGQILNVTDTLMVGVTTIGEFDPHKHQSHVCLGSLEETSVTGHFSVPSGDSNDRQSFIEGTVRFNTDLNTLEFFNGNEWRQFTYIQQNGSGLCLFGGGTGPSSPHSDVIQSLNIHTTGNTTNFGNLTLTRDGSIGMSSPIRGVFCGGRDNAPVASNTIDYVAFASGGNAEDFGDLQQAARYATGGGNGVRSLIMGGQEPSMTTMINAINITTLGNAIDTGGEYTGSESLSETVYNNQRLIMVGGYDLSNFAATNSSSNVIQTITITSSGSAIDWGSALHVRNGNGISNSTRGIIGCTRGITPFTNTMDYTTIESSGFFVNFGELSIERSSCFKGASCTLTRGVFAGGLNPTRLNVIDYVQISSLGNAIDFGDLSGTADGGPIVFGGTISNAHGGLGLGGF